MRFRSNYLVVIFKVTLALVLLSIVSAGKARGDDPLPDDAPSAFTAKPDSVDAERDTPNPTAISSTPLRDVSFSDVSFNRYVDLDQVAIALDTQGASLLTDVALQLAEGERILLRQHKSGVTAKRLLEMAAKIAAGKDQETLARLAKAADKLQDKELVSQIALLEKMDGASRATDPALTIALETANREVAGHIKRRIDAIKSADLIGDRETLREIESQLNADTVINETQKAALARMVKTARDALPTEKASAADPLARLAGVSRGDWMTRPQDWGKQGVVLFPPNRDSGSQIQVASEPSIDANGNIWSGSGSGGGSGRIVGRAQLQYNASGLAYWVSDFGNIYGRVRSPIRASRRDKGQPLGLHAGQHAVFDRNLAKWNIYEQRNGQWVLVEVVN